MIGSFLHLTKPVWGTGKLVVLDSGFCVLQGLVELKNKGAYTHTLIKKGYWPKHVLGDDIIAHFVEKMVGETDVIHGELDSIPFYLYGMKDPNYVMQIMATYGALEEKGQDKKRNYIEDRNKKVTSFIYPEVEHNHYAYRDMIDNHNSQ